ncbi:MAG: WecB/TagA/CpsF family glycosyltransferase, partial [Clostridia bacterium]|nr:WecB/TagA/CpsF family glycosyltransferase [Clostridia bacterium]
MEKVNILGVKVDMVTISEAADLIMKFMGEAKFHSVFTPNSEIIMQAYRNPEFAELLNRSDLLTADGIGVVHASKILKKPIKERAAGFDIAKQVLEKMNYTDHKLFLFGGKPGVAEKAAENLKKEYPELNIAGTRNGYFKEEDEPD